MKVLYICHHNPFGSIGGGCLASHAYLRAFCEISEGNLDLICSDSLENQNKDDIHCSSIFYVPPRNIFAKILSVYTGEMTRYVSYTKKLINSGKHYDFVVFDHSCISGHLVEFFNKRNIKTITIHHNYEPEYFEANARLLERLFFSYHVKRLEKIAYLESSANFFLTQADMAKFNESYGLTKSMNSLSGGFLYECIDNVLPTKNKRSSLTFVITGSFDCRQSFDGIKFFFSDLYDLLPVGSKVIIAGKSNSNFLKNITSNHKNVMLFENPSDVESIVRDGDIYICPTRMGGGMKFRIMDGLKCGLPIISHVNSSRGYEVLFNTPLFRSFSDKVSFSQCVELAISDLCRFDGLITQWRSSLEFFSYESGVKRISKIVESLEK